MNKSIKKEKEGDKGKVFPCLLCPLLCPQTDHTVPDTHQVVIIST
jgi:hypothetical protein